MNKSLRVTRNTDLNYVPMGGGGVKMEVKRFAQEFGSEIFSQYHEINHFETKFLVKETLMASYSCALTALKMC